MDQQSSRLGAIIEDLLTISRLEQGENSSLKRELSRISDLLANVRNLCQEEALQKKTTLIFTCDETLECAVNPGLLEQAITNLTLNAIKYSPNKATVRIDARIAEGKSGGNNGEPGNETRHLVCTVADNGIGIPERDLSRIFERFYRVDKGRSRDMGGTGLGLSIVRHIALAHGGAVTVESAEGEGSTFRLDIPV